MFKNIIKRIKRFFFKFKNNDPLFNCEYHKQHWCVLVDGPYCDFPNCDIRFEHIGKEFVYCPNCAYFDDCCSPKFGLGCYIGNVVNNTKELDELTTNHTITDTVKIQDNNPKNQSCVMTNHGLVTDVIFK